MPLPSAPEYAAVNAQLIDLQQIVAGVDWSTNLGAGAAMEQPSGEEPSLSCWPSEIATSVDESSIGVIAVTWTAAVPLGGDEAVEALLVLADMRAALVAECTAGDPRELAAAWTRREAGSDYATVTITVTEQMVSEGRST